MRRLSLPHLSPRAQLALLSAVLLTLIGIVFAVEERTAALDRATAAHEAALATRLSSARPPAGLGDGSLSRREARALSRSLGGLVSARAGSVRLWSPEGRLVYSGGRRLDRSSAIIAGTLERGLRGQVGSVRVTEASSGGTSSDQLATVIPVRAISSGPAVGAFEVRRPWENVAGRADFPSAEGLLPMLGALTLAWVGLVAAASMAIRGGGAPRPAEAQLDQLTDLPTRATFRELLTAATLTAKRDGGLVAVLVMDLDRFKEINDTLGHFNGDMLLKRIGPRLTSVLRDQDTVARLGGDEFAILLPGVCPTTRRSRLPRSG